MHAIDTERLNIRHFNIDDAAFLIRLMNTPKWLKYIGDRGIKTMETAEEYLKNNILGSYTKHGFGSYALELKHNNELIGSCGLIKRKELTSVEIGYAIMPEFEGRGYVREACMAVLELAKSKQIKLLSAICDPQNERSINLLHKIGMKYQKQILFGNEKELINYYEMSL